MWQIPICKWHVRHFLSAAECHHQRPGYWWFIWFVQVFGRLGRKQSALVARDHPRSLGCGLMKGVSTRLPAIFPCHLPTLGTIFTGLSTSGEIERLQSRNRLQHNTKSETILSEFKHHDVTNQFKQYRVHEHTDTNMTNWPFCAIWNRPLLTNKKAK